MNKHYINSCLRWLANEIAPHYILKQLPDQLLEKTETFYRSVKSAIDWFNFTKEDAKKLGFLNWDEEDQEDSIWFIPAWLYPVIPDSMILYDKNGEQFSFDSKTASKDVMFGCLTFGVKVLPEEDLQNDL